MKSRFDAILRRIIEQHIPRQEGRGVEEELLALASSGAGTLIGLMVTDAWSQAKERWQALLNRSQNTELDSEELEGTRAKLVRAIETEDTETLVQAEKTIKASLLAAATQDAAFAQGLKTLVHEYNVAEREEKDDAFFKGNSFYGPTAAQGSGIQMNRFEK